MLIIINTVGVKGISQSEAALQTGKCNPKTLIASEAKKLKYFLTLK